MLWYVIQKMLMPHGELYGGASPREPIFWQTPFFLSVFDHLFHNGSINFLNQLSILALDNTVDQLVQLFFVLPFLSILI